MEPQPDPELETGPVEPPSEQGSAAAVDSAGDEPFVDARGRVGWMIALIFACIACGLATLSVARQRDNLANPDEAAYAETAAALHDGRPLEVGFVRFYHVQYPADIVHREDFYPPGNGALLAAAWALVERSEFGSTIPSLWIACLLLPLLTFLLARRLGAAPPFAFAAGVAIMLSETVRQHAYQGLADLPLTAAVLAAVLFALRGSKLTAILAGASIAAAFWFKPAALLFLPGLALVYPLDARRSFREWVTLSALLGATFVVLIAPWLWRNYDVFGDPLYTGNKHLTASANDPSFVYEHIRKVYWADAERELPGMTASFTEFDVRHVLTRFALHLYQCTIELGPVMFGFWFLLGAIALARQRRARAVLGVFVTYLIALSAVFAIEKRYLMPVVPISIAVAWAFGSRVAQSLRSSELARGTLLESLARCGRFVPFARRLSATSWLALLGVTVATIPGSVELVRDWARQTRRFAPTADLSIKESALWARDRLPADARVMSQEALRFRYYSGLLSVNTPFDSPERIQTVIDHHGVDYIVQNDTGDYSDLANRFLERYMDEHGGAWTPIAVPDASFRVYVRDGVEPPR